MSELHYDPEKVPEDLFGQWRNLVGAVDVGDTIEVEWDSSHGEKTYQGTVTEQLERDRDRWEINLDPVPEPDSGVSTAAQIVIDDRIWVRPNSAQGNDTASSIVVSDGDELMGHAKYGEMIDISITEKNVE